LKKSAYLFPPGTASFNGEPVLSGPYDPASQASQLAALRGASSDDGSGFDWLGAAQAVAGAVLGDGVSSGDHAIANVDTGGNASTLLGDAQPFEYGGDAGAFGDIMQTAWLPSTGGPPNQWMENNSGKKQWRLYDGNGNAAVDIDFGHDHGFGAPYSHNWDNGARDNENVFSLSSY
jgi:hypothetical protein